MSRILLVDDDVDLSELIKTKLNAEGHDTHVINTGEVQRTPDLGWFPTPAPLAARTSRDHAATRLTVSARHSPPQSRTR